MFTSGRHRRTWWHRGSVVFLSMFCQDYWWCAGIIRLRRDPITIPGKIWFYRAFGPAVGSMPSSIRTFISGLARDVSVTSCLQPLAQSTTVSLTLFFSLFPFLSFSVHQTGIEFIHLLFTDLQFRPRCKRANAMKLKSKFHWEKNDRRTKKKKKKRKKWRIHSKLIYCSNWKDLSADRQEEEI